MSLTVRNLTSIPLDLILVERFKPPDSSSSPARGPGVLRSFASFSLLRNSCRPSTSTLANLADSFTCHDLDIHVPAFAARNTSLDPPCSPEQHDQHPGAVRLTFLAAGQKYRLSVPAPKLESQTLTCLAPHPKFRFTGFHVHDAGQSHVAVCDSAELHCWMKNLKDQTPLSALSIPGTHNSATCYKALPSVRCQAVGPRVQLDNGIRFFDVRVQPESEASDRLILVHSVFPISFTGTKYFRELLDHVYAFLDENPSECIIMSVKREGSGSATDAHLAHILHDSYTTTSKRWYTHPSVPTIGAVRGKIVLLRRFRTDASLAHSSGINAESWADNSPYDLGSSICVQDFYGVFEPVNIDKKVAYVTDQLRRAAECVAYVAGVSHTETEPRAPQPLYLNFLSASNFWRAACWPQQIAKSLNPAVLKYLIVSHAVDQRSDHDRQQGEQSCVNAGGDGSTGIVVCDWVGGAGDWDLVRCIVAMNYKLIMRENNGD